MHKTQKKFEPEFSFFFFICPRALNIYTTVVIQIGNMWDWNFEPTFFEANLYALI